MSWYFDYFFGSVSILQWWIIGVVVAAGVFGALRLYTGSTNAAWLAAVGALGTIVTLGGMATSRKAGREAERVRNEQAARQRANERKERNDEIDKLDSAAVDARFDRWVQDDKPDTK